jgi:hypothetical protein
VNVNYSTQYWSAIKILGPKESQTYVNRSVGYSQISILVGANTSGVYVSVFMGGVWDSFWVTPTDYRYRTYAVLPPYVAIIIWNSATWSVSTSCVVVLTTVPYSRTEPTWKEECLEHGMNVSWTHDGGVHCAPTRPIYAGGWSKLFVSFKVTDMSITGTWPYPILIWLGNVTWTDCNPNAVDGYSVFEPLSLNVLNTSIYGWFHGGYKASEPSKVIEVKGPYFYLGFGMDGHESLAPSGWILMDVYIYLRNE